MKNESLLTSFITHGYTAGLIRSTGCKWPYNTWLAKHNKLLATSKIAKKNNATRVAI